MTNKLNQEEIIFTNEVIACEPFETLSIQKEIRSGFVTVKQKSKLVELKVLFDSRCDKDTYRIGDRVIVRGDASTSPWAKDIWELQGKQFILIPSSAALGCVHQPWNPFEPTETSKND